MTPEIDRPSDQPEEPAPGEPPDPEVDADPEVEGADPADGDGGHDGDGGGDAREAPVPGGEAAGTLRGWSGWRYEALLLAEVVAVCALAFARPVLDSFGRSPETFIARGADPLTIVAFGLAVALGPPLVVGGVALASRAFGRRWVVHLAVVGVVGAIAFRRMVREASAGWGWPVVVGLGVLGGALLLVARWRLVAARSFLRFAGVASAVYLVQFLALSPTAELVVGDRVTGVDAEVAAGVSAALGEDPPDVVMLVFDALPLQTLLDGQGAIDPELYPNFAALAGTSSWYRNATTVSMYTRDAVPAILTGRFPDPANAPNNGPTRDPENLFTLLGGTYDLHVREQITQLCPEDLCPAPEPEGVGRLLGDAVTLWRDGDSGDEDTGDFSLPALLDDDRFGEAEEWIGQQEPDPDGRPELRFYHAAIPHDPWQFLPDGTVYDTERYPVGYHQVGWYGPGIEVGRQRHVLQAQAADALLGQMLDRLRESGAFDDSLVVVTADHGHAFVPDTPWRWLADDNYEELMWVPLLVKEPGQSRPRTVDDNVMSIDILPTVADLLGVELPWEVDGRPVAEAADRDPDRKYVDDDEDNYWRSGDGETLVSLDGTREVFSRVIEADPVEATGPDVVWRRTPYGDLVGRPVAELDQGEAWDGGETVTVEGLDRLEDIDTGEPLPLEVIGRSDLEPGDHVAYALNGTVGAVAEVEADERAEAPLVLGLIEPGLFEPGANDLTAYVVEGEPGSEALRPIPVA